MDLPEIQSLFEQGFDCAQSIVYALSDKLPGNREDNLRAVSCFGMGMMQGSVCGAVTGAFVTIGLRYGNDMPDDYGAKGMALVMKERFLMEFKKDYGCISCPDLMGLDVRNNEDNIAAWRDEVYLRKCPKICLRAIEILQDIL